MSAKTKEREETIFDRPPALGPEHFNVLLYGPPGTGKTTAAATAPGPIVWINLEGTGAMAYARRVAAERGTELLEMQLGPDEDPRERLRQAVAYTHGHDVGTIVIDTWGKVRGQLASAIGGDSPSLPEWGMIGKELRTILQTLRDLPVNVVLICHEQITEDEGSVLIQPEIGGRSTAEAMAEVDVLGYTGIVEDQGDRIYMARLVDGGGRRAKDRSGALGTHRQLDLSEWLETFKAALATDLSDIPFLDNDDDKEQADEG
jgi:DNA polymerase III delta prime subunit